MNGHDRVSLSSYVFMHLFGDDLFCDPLCYYPEFAVCRKRISVETYLIFMQIVS